VIGEYVKREHKARTAGGANPVAVQAELCAFAKWSRAEWMKHPAMLANTAKWIAEGAKAFGLPIRKLTAAQAQDSGRGVCQHSQLGSWGGGHWDCGPGFPIDQVLEMASGTGGGEEEMGYPDWFWQWLDWYVNTPRDPRSRKASRRRSLTGPGRRRSAFWRSRPATDGPDRAEVERVVDRHAAQGQQAENAEAARAQDG
jgi:hypothetical protein